MAFLVAAGFILAMTFVLSFFSFYVASQKSGGDQGGWWVGGGAIFLVGMVAAFVCMTHAT